MVLICIFIGIFALVAMTHVPALGILLLLIAAGSFFSGTSGGDSRDSGQSISAADPAPEDETSAADRTAFFYRGTCTALTSPIYSYRDGYIFKGVNYGLDLLNAYEYTYRDGYVRDRANRIVGKYRDSYIWLGISDAWTSDAAARYRDGYIHAGTYVPDFYIGDAIGRYTGDDEGAAACAVAMLLAQQ